MPRINRIRVANTIYDNAKKQIHDMTIDAFGLNTLLILRNGGGKTLLTQLVMQNSAAK